MLKSTVRPTGEEELDDYIKDLVEITIKMMVCALTCSCVQDGDSILVYVMCAGWGQGFEAVPGGLQVGSGEGATVVRSIWSLPPSSLQGRGVLRLSF